MFSLFSFLANVPFIAHAALQVQPTGAILTGHVSLLVCALLAANLAVFASAITKRTATAVVTSFCFILFAYFGVYALLALLFAPTRGKVGNEVWEYLALFASPIFGYFASIGMFGRRFEEGYFWIFNVVEFAFVALVVYYLTQAFYRRYRVRER